MKPVTTSSQPATRKSTTMKEVEQRLERLKVYRAVKTYSYCFHLLFRQLQGSSRRAKRARIRLPCNLQYLHWYGYRVNRDWLIAYEKAVYEGDLSGLSFLEQRARLRHALITDLATRTGIKTLSVHQRYSEGCGPKLADEWPEYMVAVCSSTPSGFARRPTQSQLDKMTEIMGYEPEWSVDAYREQLHLTCVLI